MGEIRTITHCATSVENMGIQLKKPKENLANEIIGVDQNAKYFKETRISMHMVRSMALGDLEIYHASAVVVIVPDDAQTVPVLIGQTYTGLHQEIHNDKAKGHSNDACPSRTKEHGKGGKVRFRGTKISCSSSI